MAIVMVKCPESGQAISTGIVTDRASFASTPVFFAHVFCPFCRTNHEWFAKDAWLCEADAAPALAGALNASLQEIEG